MFEQKYSWFANVDNVNTMLRNFSQLDNSFITRNPIIARLSQYEKLSFVSFNLRYTEWLSTFSSRVSLSSVMCRVVQIDSIPIPLQ